MKRILLILILILIFCHSYGQKLATIKIKHIKKYDKSLVFKFKNLETKKTDYFFSYKKDTCSNGIEIKKGKKYRMILDEINIRNQNDGNEYFLGVDDFIVPQNHKLYYSEKVKGLYLCP